MLINKIDLKYFGIFPFEFGAFLLLHLKVSAVEKSRHNDEKCDPKSKFVTRLKDIK